MRSPREAARPIQPGRTEIAVHFSRSRLAVADPQESQTNRSIYQETSQATLQNCQKHSHYELGLAVRLRLHKDTLQVCSCRMSTDKELSRCFLYGFSLYQTPCQGSLSTRETINPGQRAFIYDQTHILIVELQQGGAAGDAGP